MVRDEVVPNFQLLADITVPRPQFWPETLQQDSLCRSMLIPFSLRLHFLSVSSAYSTSGFVNAQSVRSNYVWRVVLHGSWICMHQVCKMRCWVMTPVFHPWIARKTAESVLWICVFLLTGKLECIGCFNFYAFWQFGLQRQRNRKLFSLLFPTFYSFNCTYHHFLRSKLLKITLYHQNYIEKWTLCICKF